MIKIKFNNYKITCNSLVAVALLFVACDKKVEKVHNYMQTSLDTMYRVGSSYCLKIKLKNESLKDILLRTNTNAELTFVDTLTDSPLIGLYIPGISRFSDIEKRAYLGGYYRNLEIENNKSFLTANNSFDTLVDGNIYYHIKPKSEEILHIVLVDEVLRGEVFFVRNYINDNKLTKEDIGLYLPVFFKDNSITDLAPRRIAIQSAMIYTILTEED
ncbi:MAG: hypothetical protein R2800_11015 [Flavipsychrobacter sp.]